MPILVCMPRINSLTRLGTAIKLLVGLDVFLKKTTVSVVESETIEFCRGSGICQLQQAGNVRVQSELAAKILGVK